MNLRILVCLSLALFLTLVLKSSTDFPWVDLSSTTCGYISKCYLFHLQIAFPFILSVHGVQTHYQGKWKWCLQSAVFYTTSSYLLKCWILGMLHIYINKKGKEVHICIYMHTYISVYIYIYIFFFFPSCFSRVRLCATPWTAAYQASLSMRFSRQEHWSGLPFPSPMHENGKWYLWRIHFDIWQN